MFSRRVNRRSVTRRDDKYFSKTKRNLGTYTFRKCVFLFFTRFCFVSRITRKINITFEISQVRVYEVFII